MYFLLNQGLDMLVEMNDDHLEFDLFANMLIYRFLVPKLLLIEVSGQVVYVVGDFCYFGVELGVAVMKVALESAERGLLLLPNLVYDHLVVLSAFVGLFGLQLSQLSLNINALNLHLSHLLHSLSRLPLFKYIHLQHLLQTPQ